MLGHNLALLAAAALDPRLIDELESRLHQHSEDAAPQNGTVSPSREEDEGLQELARWARATLRDAAAAESERERARDVLADLEEGLVVSFWRDTSTIVWLTTQAWEKRHQALRVGERVWRHRGQ